MRKVEISHKTIFFTLATMGLLWFLFFIRDIVLQVFVSLLLVAVLNPVVNSLSKVKIPKSVSIFLSYILIFGVFGTAIGILLPPLIEQTTNLAINLPGYLYNSGLTKYANNDVLREVVSQLGTVPGQIIKAGFSLFANILNILTVLIFTFYLLLVRDKFDGNLSNIFGKEKSENISLILKKLESRLGGWARGQLLLMLLVGILSYTGFVLLGIPFALPLALLAGIFEIVPYLGPIIAAIPAIILGFGISPFVGGATIGLAILIQQMENYIFVPKIMEKSTGVSPIITLLSLAIGARIAGIIGMVISIPIVIIIQTLLQNKFQEK